MIESTNYLNKKGIYKDLYKAIDAEKQEKQSSKPIRERKGIYKDLYQHIEPQKESKKDALHKLPLKALAYTNNVGEALKPLIGAFLAKLSWIPALFYAIFAIFTKGMNSDKDQNKTKKISREFLYQAIASFLLPDLAVKSSRKLANNFINKIPSKTKELIKVSTQNISWLDKFIQKFQKENSSGYRNFALAIAGITSLSFSIKPIDTLVNTSLNIIYNPSR